MAAMSKARAGRTHLRREVRTALELAIVALAPPAILEPLATAAGLLEAIEELAADTGPVAEFAESAEKRAMAALDRWSAWRPNRIPDPA